MDIEAGLTDFVRESNRIEGILREPTEAEVAIHAWFLEQVFITISDMTKFVAVVAPGKPLRSKPGMNVRVGSYIAPPGGRPIVDSLEALLGNLIGTPHQPRSAHAVHCEYETLHPFMDGNGRSGRALWLWMMGGIECVPLGFLHTFYYQTLGAIPYRARATQK